MIIPSILAHILNGLLILLIVIFGAVNFKKLYTLDTYHILILLLLFAILVGIHGISHRGLETTYGWSPLKIRTNF